VVMMEAVVVEEGTMTAEVVEEDTMEDVVAEEDTVEVCRLFVGSRTASVAN